ncbi:MAG: hypothetical protein KIT09_17145 [Bryobacteraceae bacterium]|nr:hypothetical protein [Bryobacteraceae bacterium]
MKANSVVISGSASVTWSDSGAQSHQVTAQSSPTTYTAAFFSGALQAVQLGNPFGTRVRPEKLAIVALKLVAGGVN